MSKKVAARAATGQVETVFLLAVVLTDLSATTGTGSAQKVEDGEICACF